MTAMQQLLLLSDSSDNDNQPDDAPNAKRTRRIHRQRRMNQWTWWNYFLLPEVKTELRTLYSTMPHIFLIPSILVVSGTMVFYRAHKVKVFMPQSEQVKDKLVVITGGTTGLGLESAKRLAAVGALVVLRSRSASKGAEAVAEVQAYLRERGDGIDKVYSICEAHDLRRAAAANAKLETIFWKSAASFSFEKYLTRLNEAFKELEDAGQALWEV